MHDRAVSQDPLDRGHFEFLKDRVLLLQHKVGNVYRTWSFLPKLVLELKEPILDVLLDASRQFSFSAHQLSDIVFGWPSPSLIIQCSDALIDQWKLLWLPK
jgi:hypothetical protein